MSIKVGSRVIVIDASGLPVEGPGNVVGHESERVLVEIDAERRYKATAEPIRAVREEHLVEVSKEPKTWYEVKVAGEPDLDGRLCILASSPEEADALFRVCLQRGCEVKADPGLGYHPSSEHSVGVAYPAEHGQPGHRCSGFCPGYGEES